MLLKVMSPKSLMVLRFVIRAEVKSISQRYRTSFSAIFGFLHFVSFNVQIFCRVN